MKTGTKSILFGAHQFMIHPWFVAVAWWKLYGFPFDPRLWIAFVVHDLGYFGKPNMDGKEGEQHPYWGACVMGALFGKKWFDFVLYHSRFLAKQNGAQFSRLCVADKLAIVLTPCWLYLPMAKATGEIKEYMDLAKGPRDGNKYAAMNDYHSDEVRWFQGVKEYLVAWVDQHKEGGIDTWTPEVKAAAVVGEDEK